MFFQEHLRCGFLDAVMVFFSAIGDAGIVWIIFGLALAVWKKHRSDGVTVLFCLLLGWVVTNLLLKNIVGRPRPFEVFDWLTVLVKLPRDPSFPSGHTCASFAAAYGIAKTMGKKWAWVYIPAALVALSRLHVGVHFPTDVLAGAAVGTICAAVMCRVRAKHLRIPGVDQKM